MKFSLLIFSKYFIKILLVCFSYKQLTFMCLTKSNCFHIVSIVIYVKCVSHQRTDTNVHFKEIIHDMYCIKAIKNVKNVGGMVRQPIFFTFILFTLITVQQSKQMSHAENILIVLAAVFKMHEETLKLRSHLKKN